MSRMAQMGFEGCFFGVGVMYGLGAWKDAATVGENEVWKKLCAAALGRLSIFQTKPTFAKARANRVGALLVMGLF